MKKIFNFMMIALVAMVAFTSCSDDCNHEYIEHDYTQDLVGTWTCMDADHAEALVFKAGGTFASYGVSNGEYSEELNATWVLKNNKLTLAAGDYKSDVVLEIVPGKSMALVDEKGKRNVFEYCANDLADEVVGMWVCNEGLSGAEKDMGIITYSENGKAMFTGNNVTENNDNLLGLESTYKVVGNILFQTISYPSNSGVDSYMAIKLAYVPNSTSLGDIMTQTTYLPRAEVVHKSTSTWLRVKQSLNLTNKSYDYSDVYVTNVKGLDKDIPFHPEYTFNFAKMDGTLIDKILKSILFSIEFPDANTFKYSCSYPNPNTSMEAPMVVNGNKVTVKMSERNPAYRDIDFHMYQDADDSQLHMYLPTYSFINFYGNMQIIMMEQLGQIDTTDATAVKAVYDSLDEAVETINMSFVLKARN